MKNAQTPLILRNKVLLVLCTILAVVVVSATSVLATVAYLTSSAAVSNVFTVGNVGITMTESKVTPDGKLYDDGLTRVDTNTYNLVPNTTYVKDPKIFVNAGSENSYLFVLVRNDIEKIECTDSAHEGHFTIAQQLANYGWAKFAMASTGWVYVYVGVGNVPDGDVARVNDPAQPYVYQGNAELVTAGEYKIFDNFSIAKEANVSAYGAAKITLTGVAIQAAGFDNNVRKAWNAVVETYPYIHTNGSVDSNVQGGNQ